MIVAEVARSVRLNPTAMPTPAVTHISAAVVKPDTPYLPRKIVPAPRNPIPGIICAAMRPGSPIWYSLKVSNERMAKRQLPRAISEKVRMLGSFPASSRSTPIRAPRNAAMKS